MDEDNVVPLRRRNLAEEFRRANYADRHGKCRHRGTKIVDEDQRTVECEDCKAILDPVACLIEIANDWHIYHQPRLNAIREYMAARKLAKEKFLEWWTRVGRGRNYPTKQRAAEEAWLIAAAPELVLCDKINDELVLK